MAEKIVEQNIANITTYNFTEYAKEVSARRALPDARDGLKPVTRRVLYSMLELSLDCNISKNKLTNEIEINEKPYKKSARVVGDTMGKYHPHGDSSIYGALVTATQDFRNSCPPISGYGNFGTWDDSAAAMRYCVTGDTLINTNNGLMEIKDIVENSVEHSDNPIDITIQSMNSIKNKASMFFNSGKHKTIEIVLKNGMFIKGSYNHPILTIQEQKDKTPILVWKTLETINKTDKIVVNRNYNIQSTNNKISIEEARFLGLFISEGTIYSKLSRLDFINKDEDIIAEMKKYLSTIFNLHICEYKRKDECISLQIHSKENFQKWINKYDLKKYAENKIVPKVVLQSNINIQKEFLKYLYEGDGSVSFVKDKRKDSYSSIISYSSNSIKLLKTMQIMLLQFGIYSSFSNVRNNTYRLNISGKQNIISFYENINFVSKKKKEKLKQCFDYAKKITNFETFGYDYIPYIKNYICGKYNNEIEKISFSNKRKFIKNKEKLLKLLSKEDFDYLENLHNLNYLYLDINEINYCDEEVVYSIRVDSDCHSFIGNGFVNHNTEARLSPYGTLLLEGLNKNATPFQNNFDVTEKEPVYLPSIVPNLLINGEFGISVGYSCNIPPHNLAEVCDSYIYRIQNPKCELKDLLKILKGPDFPTYGQVSPEGLQECYEKGNGKFQIRAILEMEKLPKGKIAIIAKSIPFGVKPESLIEKIANTFDDPSYFFEGIENTSDKDGVCIRILFDSGAPIKKIIDRLYTKTDLQINYGYNFLATINDRPILLGLMQYYDYLIEDKTNIIKKIIEYDLNKAKHDLLVIEAKLLVSAHSQEIIDIMRKSKDATSAANTIAETFNISFECAKIITEMRLYSLKKQEISKLKDAKKEKQQEIKKLESILKSKQTIQNELIRRVEEYKEFFGKSRKTKIKKFTELDIKESSDNDFILQVIDNKYNVLNSQSKARTGILLKIKPSNTILSFLENGKFVKFLGTSPRKEETTKIVNSIVDKEDTNFVLHIVSNGQVQKTELNAWLSSKENRVSNAMKIEDNDTIIQVFELKEDVDIVIETQNNMCIRFGTDEIRATGTNTGGMRGITLSENDKVINAYIADKKCKITKQKRGGKGSKKK